MLTKKNSMNSVTTKTEIHKFFRFIMRRNYHPEIQAESCLINFAVTKDGLADQLLAIIVRMERPKLSQRKE